MGLLEIGKNFGDFCVVRLLGQGGMGEVYLLRSIHTGNLFAAKIMHHPADEEVVEFRTRFLHEAEIAMRIEHRNLIKVYDVGEDPETGLCYMIMDYISGGSLTARIRNRGPLSIREALSAIIQISSALSLAHAQGIVHRDIKSDNIMFDGDGIPKLADMGIAKVSGGTKTTTVTTTGIMIGTPAYMAPEQMMDSHNVDARADIYSLGIVFYEMLTGLRPHGESTAVEIVAKAVRGESIPDVRDVRPDVPAGVAALISRMCAPNKDDRPQTLAEVVRLCQAAAIGKTIKPNRKSGAKPGKRNYNLVAVIAGAAVAVFGIAGAVLALKSGGNATSAPTPVVITNVVEVVRVVTNEVAQAAESRPAYEPSGESPPTGSSRSGAVKPIIDNPNYEARIDGDKLIVTCCKGKYDVASVFGVRNGVFTLPKELAGKLPEDVLLQPCEMCFGRTDPNLGVDYPRWISIRNGSYGGALCEKLEIDEDRAFTGPNGEKVPRLVYPFKTDKYYVLLKPGDDLTFAFWEKDNQHTNRLKRAESVRFAYCGKSLDLHGFGVYKKSEQTTYNPIFEFVFNIVKTSELDENARWLAFDSADGARLGYCFTNIQGKLALPKEIDGKKIVGADDSHGWRIGNRESITGIEIPEGYVDIKGDWLFANTAIRELRFPDSFKRLEVTHHTFGGSKNLERVYLNKCERFAGCNFSDCPRLERFEVAPDNKVYKSLDGAIYNHDYTYLVAYPQAKQNFWLSPRCKSIGFCALSGCKFTKLKIPEGVRSIGAYAFERSPNLEEVEMPESLEYMVANAFNMCPKMRKLVIHGDGKVWKSKLKDMPGEIRVEYVPVSNPAHRQDGKSGKKRGKARWN